MKTKNASGLVVGIVITLFIVIILGVVILWGSGYFNQNKKSLDQSTGKIDKTLGTMSEFDLEVYDDNSLSGAAVVELIEDLEENATEVSIGVQTLDATSPTYYNYAFTSNNLGAAVTVTPTPVKSAENYINQNASFLGKTIRNENDQIICVLFTQQK